MEEVTVRFEIKRKKADHWYIFQGELNMRPDKKTSFDPEAIRTAAVESLRQSAGQYPEDELILTFEKP